MPTQERDHDLQATLYAQQLESMRFLQERTLNTTIKVFSLNLLVAGACIARDPRLAPSGAGVGAALLLAFNGSIAYWIKRQAEAYARRQTDMQSLWRYLRSVAVHGEEDARTGGGGGRGMSPTWKLWIFSVAVSCAVAITTLLSRGSFVRD